MSAQANDVCILEMLPQDLRAHVLEFSGGAAWHQGVWFANKALRRLCLTKKMRDALRRWAMAVFKRGMDRWEGANGVVKDGGAGTELVMRAAAVGLRPAQAWCFHYGWGVERDYAKAAALYQAELDGSASESVASGGACCWSAFMLAEQYRYGFGVVQDEARAVELYTRAVEIDGNGVAMNTLADIFEQGWLGQGVDEERALSLYKRSAALGGCMGMHDLGYVFAHGSCGVEVDLKQALHWFEKALHLLFGQEQMCGTCAFHILRVRAAIATQSDSNSDAEE